MSVFDDPAFLKALNRTKGFHVDIVICLDVTGAMQPIACEIQDHAPEFCARFREGLAETGRAADALRVRLIFFRDYACDSVPMEETGFFALPDQAEDFLASVSAVHPCGGGDEPECALEALALAMRSDWTREGTRRRHIILMLTDASAVPLGDPFRTSSPSYPKDMPASLAELYGMWEDMPSKNSARLVLFAPEAYPWTDLMDWNNVWACFCQPGGGLGELDFDMITQVLVSAV